jgi:peptidoglycan/xylan/chitin deacetylase (PgdA/CDA1 family)/spore germination protein YaaH/GT2 family glycosyltransferase
VREWAPRLAASIAIAAGVAALWRRDAVAGAAALVGMTVVSALVLRRGPGAIRRSVLTLLVGVTALAILSAVLLAVPLRQLRPQGPLLVTPPGTSTAPVATSAATDATVLGFVTPDYGDAGAVLDRAAPLVTTVAATGITLGRKPGTIDVLPPGDALARAHLHGATALAVVSNYDGTIFNGDRAAAVLKSPEARHKLVSALVAEMDDHGWDGIVLDIERLPAHTAVQYPMLVADLERAAGDRPVLVAVPARDPAERTAPDGYDLASLGQAADQVVWMAYDEHTAATAPGPVAGLPWVRRTLEAARKMIPPEKLLLGIAGYGYGWSAGAPARDLTVAEALALAGQPGSTAEFDEVEQEWRVRAADGTEAWYSDARSTAARAALVAEQHLAGVAIWRLGAEDPAALASLPFPARRSNGVLPGGGAEVVEATGLVALTFDDGPDPRFTSEILDILRREQVPATFFVIANQAQAHPGLLRKEVGAGHVVANHTYSHLELSAMPKARAEAEILAGAAVIEGIIGRKPALFRAPFGEDRSGGNGGGDSLAADLGMRPVRWTDDSADWRRPGVDAIVEKVLAPASGGGASPRKIVLLHDGGGDRSQTVAALPRIIEGLRAQGYAFTTVDRLEADVSSPYVARAGATSRARGVGIIAGYRLQLAFRHVVMALLGLIVFLSLWRIAVGGPLALWHRFQVKRRSRVWAGQGVSFTVVVPAHNEERVIAKALGALELARVPGVEVIVVDDGSTDATAEIAAAFDVRVIRQPQGGKAAALNTGIAAASGEVIVVLDADTVLDPDFLDAVAPHFADPAVGAVAGNIKVGNRRSILAKLQALEYIVSLDIDRRTQDVLGVIAVVPGAAGAFRRAALIDVGGYPSDTLVEDADLTIALLRGGWRIHYEPAALAYTEAPEGVADALRQRRRWGYGNVEVLAKHSRSMLHPGSGRVGLLGLPWMLMSQVLLPLGGPLADAFLLYLLLVGQFNAAAVLLLLALGLDLALTAAVVLAEGEDRRMLAVVPLLRLVWRPLQLLAVVGSVARWLSGEGEHWRRVRRLNSVIVPAVGVSRVACGK